MSSTEKSLVIVESPAKARTIASFLPKGFQVEASIGHIRDLPTSAAEIPASIKGNSWVRLGIDIENGFKPFYVVPSEKRKQVQKLKKALKDADVVYLATDEDREGESISWHLTEVLKPKVPLRRLVFHEITKEAIQRALEQPRELDEGLVRAQEARRILDRLYGYEISPILWRKIRPRLSAGRVQSVAVRLCVDRERLRRRFVRSGYWDLRATFVTDKNESFEADLVRVGENRLVSGKDFDSATGDLKADATGLLQLSEERALELAEGLREASWQVSEVEERPYTTNPAAPFTTSTLQQDANRTLRYSARRTMQVAQRLYENGHITYMRTDSTTLAESAVTSIRSLIQDRYGEEYLSSKSLQYNTKVKNAQEAHEAIRPSSVFKRPRELAQEVGNDELKLYELIWKRTMACQMAQARGHNVTVRVSASEAVFAARGKTIEFPGFLRAYAEGSDEPAAVLADREILLPRVAVDEALDCSNLDSRGHTTQPPARYTEASLVKELEAKGIGRPSTYASIIDTILHREYVVKQGNALVPTFTAFAVVKLLKNFFADLVDVNFTARMENALDEISLGKRESLPYLHRIYYGLDNEQGLHALTLQEIDARESCTLLVANDENGEAVNVRVGRYGPYIERGDERASIPDKVTPDELSLEMALELLEKGSGPRELGLDDASGKQVYVKTGRFGAYVQLGDADDDEKPKMKSLLPGMEAETVGIEEALALLSLPRSIGVDPQTGEEIFVDLGRYGAYIKSGKETRSLDAPEQVLTVSLDQAVAKLREEKKSRRGAPAVLKELGNNPEGVAIRLLDGRYGPYVADGKTNASVPKGTDPDSVTLQDALDLIQIREAKGPRKRPARAKKKVAKKKVAKKKAARKKATAKKKT